MGVRCGTADWVRVHRPEYLLVKGNGAIYPVAPLLGTWQ